MSKVYLVCRNVDLGYHVEYAFSNKETANDKMNSLNSLYEQRKITDLIKNCNYTSEMAVKWIQQNGIEYFVEIMEVL